MLNGVRIAELLTGPGPRVWSTGPAPYLRLSLQLNKSSRIHKSKERDSETSSEWRDVAFLLSRLYPAT